MGRPPPCKTKHPGPKGGCAGKRVQSSPKKKPHAAKRHAAAAAGAEECAVAAAARQDSAALAQQQRERERQQQLERQRQLEAQVAAVKDSVASRRKQMMVVLTHRVTLERRAAAEEARLQILQSTLEFERSRKLQALTQAPARRRILRKVLRSCFTSGPQEGWNGVPIKVEAFEEEAKSQKRHMFMTPVRSIVMSRFRSPLPEEYDEPSTSEPIKGLEGSIDDSSCERQEGQGLFELARKALIEGSARSRALVGQFGRSQRTLRPD